MGTSPTLLYTAWEDIIKTRYCSLLDTLVSVECLVHLHQRICEFELRNALALDKVRGIFLRIEKHKSSVF